VKKFGQSEIFFETRVVPLRCSIYMLEWVKNMLIKEYERNEDMINLCLTVSTWTYWHQSWLGWSPIQ